MSFIVYKRKYGVTTMKLSTIALLACSSLLSCIVIAEETTESTPFNATIETALETPVAKLEGQTSAIFEQSIDAEIERLMDLSGY